MSNSCFVKVADFGLARYVKDDEYTSRNSKFPVRWSPLEVLHHGRYNWISSFCPDSNMFPITWSFQNRFSSKSDVWSFGVLCWEVFSKGLIPYAGLKNIEVVNLLESGQTLKCPLGCLNSVYAVSGQVDTHYCFQAIKKTHLTLFRQWKLVGRRTLRRDQIFKRSKVNLSELMQHFMNQKRDDQPF
jgi:serine/threonine protein kinase